MITFFVALSPLTVVAAELHVVDDPDEIVATAVDGSTLTVLNLWATWCAPCVAEMNDLRAMAERFDEDSVRFVGLSLDDAIPGDRDEIRKRVEQFLDRQKIAYPNIYWVGTPDLVFRRFDLSGEIPVTLVLDSEGNELFRHEGVIKRNEFEREIVQQLQTR